MFQIIQANNSMRHLLSQLPKQMDQLDDYRFCSMLSKGLDKDEARYPAGLRQRLGIFHIIEFTNFDPEYFYFRDSDRFYSHTYGYKLQLQVRLLNKTLDIFLYGYQGRNDDDLDWPARIAWKVISPLIIILSTFAIYTFYHLS